MARAHVVDFWERERVVAALAGAQLCPRYRMPCWICCLLHILTGTLRSVTEGRFERFEGRGIFTWAEDADGHFARWCASRGLICPHHPAASSDDYRQRLTTDSDLYWYTDSAPSLTTTPVTPARNVSAGTSQTEATEESTSRLPVLQASQSQRRKRPAPAGTARAALRS
jgi:hypothetical protein